MKTMMCLLFFVTSMTLADVTVTFNVDMQHARLDSGDRIAVRGDRPELGFWIDSKVFLQQVQGNVYQASVYFTDDVVGQTVLYKYVVEKENGHLVWEERGNRTLVLTPSNIDLPEVFFSDVDSPGLRQAVTIRFLLDLTQLSLESDRLSGVRLLGSRTPLSWDLTGDPILLTDSDGDNIWDVSVHFPIGTQQDYSFKFAYRIDGEWQWESLPGHINHAALISDASPIQDVRMIFNPEKSLVEASVQNSSFVDQYDQIIARLGAYGFSTDYSYFQSIALLKQGESAKAQSLYEIFRQHHPGGVEIDDFYYLWAKDLSDGGKVDEAVAFCKTQQARELDAFRRGYFSYLQGEILLNVGRRAEARQMFDEALAGYSDEPDIRNYATYGKAVSLLQETDEVMQETGAELLQSFIKETDRDSWKRMSLMGLFSVYDRLNKKEDVRRTLERLTQIGTVEQRWDAKIRLLKFDLQDFGDLEQQNKIQALLQEAPVGRAKVELLYLEGVSLIQAGEEEQGKENLEQLQRTYPKSGLAKTAKQYVDELAKKGGEEL